MSILSDLFPRSIGLHTTMMTLQAYWFIVFLCITVLGLCKCSHKTPHQGQDDGNKHCGRHKILSINGYRLFRQDRNSHGGGVATYITKKLLATPLFDLQHKYVQSGLEITIVEVLQRRSHAAIVLIGVYRPPQAKSHWFDLFNDLTLHLLTRGKLIICLLYTSPSPRD